MEFDATLEKEAMEIIFNLIQNTSKIVLFRAYYEQNFQNPVYLELGKTAGNILGISQRIDSIEFLSHIHPDHSEKMNLIIEDLIKINKHLDYEVQFYNSEIKKYIWIHILSNYLPIDDENKDKKCVIGIMEDITDIKNRELRLNKKDEQLQNYKVISVIASMLMHKNDELTSHISEILKTMGNSLKASYIAIYKDINNDDVKDSENLHKYNLADKWCDHHIEKSCKEFDDIFIKKLLTELDCSSMKMYTEKTLDEYPSELIPLLEGANIGSFLRLPIFIGKNRYGVMIVNYSDRKRKFKHNEIVLSLNIAYLIGLGLKINKENDSKLNFLQFFDDLKLGLFILQQNEEGIYKFVYVNSQICKFSGYSKEEMYNVSNFTEIVSVEDESFMRSFESKEFAVKNLPRSFDINVNLKNGIVPAKVWLSNDEFNNHYAIYGIIQSKLNDIERNLLFNKLSE